MSNDKKLQTINPSPPADPMVSMIERIALDPDIPIEKLERMLAMKERLEDRALEEQQRAQKQAYYRAMAACQSELKVVTKNQRNNQTQSSYADLAALSKTVDPVIHEHGFSLSFQPAGTNDKNELLIQWTIAHRDGHIESDVAAIPADKTGAQGKVNKTDIHAFGSAATYGRRYLKLMLFDIATGDDDGNAVQAGSNPINEKQYKELVELGETAQGDMSKFCSAFDVTDLADLPQKDFFRAKAALQARALKLRPKVDKIEQSPEKANGD